MKGLFLKDYYLNFSNRRSLFLFLFMSIFMAFAMDGSFIIGYTGMLMGILAIGTISYDSNENGMAFLMYIYTFLMEMIGCLVGVIIYYAASLIKGMKVDAIAHLSFGASFALVMSLMMALMILIELKYGVEKSRTVMLVVYGIVFILAFAVKQIPGLQRALISFVNFLSKAPAAMIAVAVLAIYLTILFILYSLSLRAMEKKEF